MTVTDRTDTATDRAREARTIDLAAALAPLLARGTARGRRTLVSATVPVAWRDPVALFAAARAIDDEAAIWLQPDAGFGLVAIGAAWTVEGTGEERFRQVATAWSELVADALVGGPDGVPGTGPLLLGGFGFGNSPASSPTWAGFESARLGLPSLLMTVTPAMTWLTASVVVTPGGKPSASDAEAKELDRRWARLVARALGATQVLSRPDSSRYLDVTVLLGGTWRPPAEPFYP